MDPRKPREPLTFGVRSLTERLHGLDTLRALAILLVMPFHLSDHFPEVLQFPCQFGWIGVDLFFVLSGFLIGSQIFRAYMPGETGPGQGIPGPAHSIGAFYRKRAYRILPAFAVVLLLYVAVPVWRESSGLQPWWQFATFTENFLIDYRINKAFSHAWSLCVEEHFYLVLPLLTALLMRRPAAWKTYALLLGVLLAGILVRYYVLVHILRPLGPDADDFSSTYIKRIYYPTYSRLDGLAAGVSLALLRTFRPAWWLALRSRGHGLTVGGLALVGATLWCSTQRFQAVYGRAALFDLAGYPVLAVGFALLVASALSNNGLLARVHLPGASLLATLSFSLYLTHKEAVHLLFTWWPGLPEESFWLLPLMLGVSLLVAGTLYLAVERPFLALRDRSMPSAIPLTPGLEARVDPAL